MVISSAYAINSDTKTKVYKKVAHTRHKGCATFRHYKIFCVNAKYGIQYGFRIFYLIALQNEENYEREESCSD